MVLKLIFISLIGLIHLNIEGESLYEKNVKKANKTLTKLWEDNPVRLIPVHADEDLIAENNAVLPELFNVIDTQNEAHLAYVCLVEAPSKVDTFTFMVVYNLDLSIKHIEVLEYKENYGGEISSKRFLKQYQGKTGSQNLELGKDIDGISGATISVLSMNHAVKKLNNNMITLKNIGII